MQQVRLRIVMPPEGARNGPGRPGRPEGAFPCVCWGLRESLSGSAAERTASDCAPVRSPFNGEQRRSVHRGGKGLRGHVLVQFGEVVVEVVLFAKCRAGQHRDAHRAAVSPQHGEQLAGRDIVDL